MHAIELPAPDLATLRTVVRPDPPAPGPGRILVRMRAASLNFLDTAVAAGQYDGLAFPIVPLIDGAGDVIATGPDVWQVRVGDRVALNPKPRWIAGAGTAETARRTRGVNLPGTAVETAELDAASVARAPDHLTWEEIAAIPVAGVTAWKALEVGAIGPASTVVLLGTGGVSIFALQLAKARGARVMVTSSSNDKLARARTLGADDTINYREQPDWDDAVRTLTDGNGADLVIDSAGGPEFNRSLRALRFGGLVFAIGFVGGTTTTLDLLALNGNGLRIEGINGTAVVDLAATMRVIAAHRLRPVIDRVFPGFALVDAYRLMQAGGHFGKIAVAFDW